MNWDEGSTFAFEIHTMSGTTLPAWGDAATQLGATIEPSQIYPMGYHTIILETPIVLPTASKFAVLAKFIAPSGYEVIIPVETAHEYAAKHTASAGESYISPSGTGNWLDIGESNASNLFIKVMTKEISAQNIAPTLTISSSTLSYSVNELMNFTAVATDSDGNITSYLWDFGDGNSSTKENPTYAYSTTGIHTVTCTVTDNEGQTVSDSLVVSIKELVWQDNSGVELIHKQWLSDENNQLCYDNTQPDGRGEDYPSCHDTSGDTAATYCSELSLDGYTNWRLPTADELIATAELTFTYATNGFYWSSSELEEVAPSAYMVPFGTTQKSWNGKDADYYVRCVREQ